MRIECSKITGESINFDLGESDTGATGDGNPKKAQLLAILNEKEKFISDKTELYLKRFKGEAASNVFYAQEIGIGYTITQAKKNYGQLSFEEIPNAFNNYEKMLKEVRF